jgi:hypothetical protein
MVGGRTHSVHSTMNFKDDLAQLSPLLNLQVRTLSLSVKKRLNEGHKGPDRAFDPSFMTPNILIPQLGHSKEPRGTDRPKASDNSQGKMLWGAGGAGESKGNLTPMFSWPSQVSSWKWEDSRVHGPDASV